MAFVELTIYIWSVYVSACAGCVTHTHNNFVMFVYYLSLCCLFFTLPPRRTVQLRSNGVGGLSFRTKKNLKNNFPLLWKVGHLDIKH